VLGTLPPLHIANHKNNHSFVCYRFGWLRGRANERYVYTRVYARACRPSSAVLVLVRLWLQGLAPFPERDMNRRVIYALHHIVSYFPPPNRTSPPPPSLNVVSTVPVIPNSGPCKEMIQIRDFYVPVYFIYVCVCLQLQAHLNPPPISYVTIGLLLWRPWFMTFPVRWWA